MHRMINRLRNHADRVAEGEGRPRRRLHSPIPRYASMDDVKFLSKNRDDQIDAYQGNLNKLFRYIDREQDNYITIDQLLDILNLDNSLAYSHCVA